MAVAQQAASEENRINRIGDQDGTLTMREFFRGWKRKTGCVTLLIACVFAAAWVRSYAREDSFGARLRILASHVTIQTSRGVLLLTVLPNDDEFPNLEGWTTRQIPIRETSTSEEVNQVEEIWLPKNEAARTGSYARSGNRFIVLNGYCVMVPQSMIVIPLTLISAWPLLSKPRAKKLSTESPPETEP